ncbi:glycosyl hydrolase family 8 [Vibrio penaeicida]|uniref:cellulase n=1 Tax=Vibrio penaeicida TaxID=104609 RepID=A0AAV5NU85_9VIBR|nr:glycosyl hydrolase family 8 [Vibrio penaeicida]RTZ20624.1 endoglucanase [Vibrio penaeicida]GLQ74286.1 hypothetical protein GCM10007932_36470 [Vibrio penaeicida]
MKKKTGFLVVAATSLVVSTNAMALAMCESDIGMWHTFKNSFVNQDGRVVDVGNQGISHSEGQGYGMLIAEYFGDKATFDRMWHWTKKNLQRKEDGLFSWKWQPKKPHIPDRNNASDGDVLIAWALQRAQKQWSGQGYGSSAKQIVNELQKSHIKTVNQQSVLLPGAYGFSFDDRTVVNPAYWVYPALQDFNQYSRQWSKLSNSGLSILNQNLYGREKLTSDWLEYKNGGWKPASGFESRFSYSSYRIPLYVIWGGQSHQLNTHYTSWLNQNTAWVNVRSGESASYPPPDGAIAIAQLVRLSRASRKKGQGIKVYPKGKDYYSDSLVLLSHIAYNERICQ